MLPTLSGGVERGLERELEQGRGMTLPLIVHCELPRSITGSGTGLIALLRFGDAVGLYRDLARARPEAFTPYLAGSLNNLAAMLSELGQREEGARRRPLKSTTR
jgi:hypothetical protein